MGDEAGLLERVLRRDEAACRELVRMHHARLVAVARTLVGQAAEDVVQEAWLSAFRALPRFEGRASLSTWLTRIVINAAYGHRRYDRSRLTLSLETAMGEDMPLLERFDGWGHWNEPLANWQADTPEEILARAQLADALQRHLHALPEAQRLAILLRDQSGLEFAEIADALGTTEGNVRVLLHRGRLKLLAVINAFEEGKPC